MRELIRRDTDTGVAIVAYTTKSDGDLSPAVVEPIELEHRRRSLVPRPWIAVRQVHSDRVIRVGEHAALEPRLPGDALVTERHDVALAVHSGDCVPIGFIHDSGWIGVAHAGWRGLERGVLESTVRQLRHHAPARDLVGVVGPHIHAERYEFSDRDLHRLVTRFGPAVRARTSQGRPALDLSAAVACELERLEVSIARWSNECTGLQEEDFWSHRARGERGRFAMVAWLEDAS